MLAGAGTYAAYQAVQLRHQVQTLQQQQAPLAADVLRLRADNERLSNLVAQASEQKALTRAQFNELLKLRGQSSQARTTAQELAKLKTAARQNGAMPALFNGIFTNAMAVGAAMGERMQKQRALDKVARMKEKLHLTDEQAQAISDLMVRNIETRSQQALNALSSGNWSDAMQAGAQSRNNEEAEIKALLTPEQLAAYPDFQQSETAINADNSAKSELAVMATQMELSQEQQDKIHAALYQYELSRTPAGQNGDALAQAAANGNYADVINSQFQAEQQALQDKLKILAGILTPEQLQTYQQKQTDMLDMESSAVKMFLPQTTNAAAP